MPTLISSGRNYKIYNVALNGTYADITILGGTTSFLIQVQNDSRVLWRKNATDTTEFTFKEGVPYSIDGTLGASAGTNITIGQAKTVSGNADTLELWVWFS